jgi:hypothetical protein
LGLGRIGQTYIFINTAEFDLAHGQLQLRRRKNFDQFSGHAKTHKKITSYSKNSVVILSIAKDLAGAL